MFRVKGLKIAQRDNLRYCWFIQDIIFLLIGYANQFSKKFDEEFETGWILSSLFKTITFGAMKVSEKLSDFTMKMKFSTGFRAWKKKIIYGNLWLELRVRKNIYSLMKVMEKVIKNRSESGNV